MTYRELGKARGISAASAARLAYRKGWQRQPGNDGAARVAVPVGEDQPSPYDARGGTGDAAMGEAPGHGARDAHAAEFALAIEALRGELTASHQREAEAHVRADRAEAAAAALREQIETERQRADHAEQGREGERARADELRDRIEVMAADLAAARGAENRARAETDLLARKVNELTKANDARRASGRWARLRSAWRGE